MVVSPIGIDLSNKNTTQKIDVSTPLTVLTTSDAAVEYNAIEKRYSKNSEKLHWLKCWGNNAH